MWVGIEESFGTLLRTSAPVHIEGPIAGQPAASPEQPNAASNTVARFLNMHAQAGVPLERDQPVILCGQSAASRGIDASELLPGVQVALSARTAFIALQDQSYRVNPG